MGQLRRLAAYLAMAGACGPLAARATDCTSLATRPTGEALHGATGLVAEPIANEGKLARACRVSGALHPVPGSTVGFELLLPVAWNGRLLMLGNGGYSSDLPRRQMLQAVGRGYAVAATDTGHQGDDPIFGRDAPEAIEDWGHRAVHVTAQAALAITTQRYGRPPRHRYFEGCSTGGHQALMEAQRYPDDFDGIVAGAPGYNRVRLNAGFLWQFVANHTGTEGSQPLLAPLHLALLARASLAACRGDNGGRAGGLASDAFLDNPLLCRFDPATLACKGGASSDCLSQAQVSAARRMYAGAQDPVTGERIYPGWPAGSEASDDLRSGWHIYWADPRDGTQPARGSFWRYWAGFGAGRPWASFDFHDDLARAQSLLSARIDATSADLDAFARHGGKLIHYHGEADPVVPFADSIAYHDAVLRRRAHAPPAADYYRLFLAPGMGHCIGGSGYMPADALGALERWVEAGVAPTELAGIAASQANATTLPPRPLCPYPRVASNMAATGQPPRFACRAPGPG